ncbi:hypothetical protein C6P40_001914 [Pichia californica]|uniref:separase n=1 Tax=Pichia californica TaxID=460514 RepID=A0A9P7BH02_9ASCO|nr:hypothetical protein C6P40_001914 [[Candida] californica]
MLSQEISIHGGETYHNTKKNMASPPILSSMLDKKSINNELIRQYNHMMDINYDEIIITERNWNAVIVNMQILEILIQSNTDVQTVKSFISNISKLFLGLTNTLASSNYELKDMISYKLKSDDLSIIPIYLQLKVNLLRVCALDDKILFNDIKENYDSKSNFYKLFSDSPTSKVLSYSLTSSFLKLSSSTKTIFKLVFLILATHYSTYTDNFRIELLDKINKDASKMLLKSDKLVYKSTAEHLYSLAQLCKSKNIESLSLDTILKKYNSINPSYSDNLLKSLDNINISQNIISIINSPESFEMIQSKTFAKELNSYIKSMDLNLVPDLQSLEKIISLIISKKENVDLFLGSIDQITIKLKDINCNLHNITYIYDALTKLSTYLYLEGQHKKLHNFQRLLFHFGNMSLDIDPIISVLFWASFIKLDNKLSTNWDSKLLTFRRLVFVSNDQVLKNNSQMACIIQLNFLNTISNDDQLPHQYESLLQNDLLASIKIISKCIINDEKCLNFLLKYIESESLIVSVVCEIVNCIEYSNVSQKDYLISQIIVMQKEQLKDTGLFLFFLSKISTVVDFPINFRNSDLSFNEDSIIIGCEQLVISHLYMMQSFSNTQNNLELIVKGYHSITKWIQNIQVDFTKYEFDVIKTVYYTLKYHNLYQYCSIMIKQYLCKREGQLASSEINLLISFTLNSLVKLQQFKSCESLITHYPQYCGISSINTYEEMNLSLELLQYYLLTKELEAESQIKNIMNIFITNDQFIIEKQSNKYQAVELLMMHARFCKISGMYKISNHLNCVTNLNRSINILQSIFKNFLLQGPKIPSLNVNFKSVLKMRFSYEMLSCYILLLDQYSIIGFGKEYEHFLRELETFIKVQPSVNLQYVITLKLIDFNIFKGSLNTASKLMQVVNVIQGDVFDDGNKINIISGLMTCENYARALGDEELVQKHSEKLDSIIIEYMDSGINMNLIKLWTVVLRRRYEKYFHSDDKLLKNYNIDNFIAESCQVLNEERDSTNVVSCYPIKEHGSDTKVINYKVERLKGLNSKLIEHSKNNFEISNVDISRTNLDMIINCFVNMVNSDNDFQYNTEMDQIISLNNQYKEYPFQLEKQFALNEQKPRCVLPQIGSLPKNIALSATSKINFSNLLPPDWQILSIDYVIPTNSLVILRYDSKNSEPLFVNLSLKEKEEQYSFKNIFNSLNEIIEESDKTTSSDVTNKIKTYSEKSQWWDTRQALDERLEELLNYVDIEWFGGFNSLFQSEVINIDDIQKFKDALSEIIYQYVKNDKLDLIKQGLFKIHDSIFELFLKIDRISVKKITDLLWFLFETMGINCTTMFDENEILDMANNLKKYIVSFTKKRIIDDNSNSHTVLILGASCTKLPWESIPSLRSKSVTRMPTLSQLESYLIKHKNLLENGIDPCKGYYVINPGGDLVRTEANLGSRFRTLNGWEGLVGEPPSDFDIEKAFDESNLYIYAGHGGGEQYIKSKKIKKRSYIPPSLLLGCSSGSLKGDGSIYQYGTAYNYINGGCPMLLVNLWDVTDKDIDLFTIDALTKWGFFVDYDSFDPFAISENNPMLSQCVAKSRDVCKLKYLNGAAPIIYGLPLRLETM